MTAEEFRPHAIETLERAKRLPIHFLIPGAPVGRTAGTANVLDRPLQCGIVCVAGRCLRFGCPGSDLPAPERLSLCLARSREAGVHAFRFSLFLISLLDFRFRSLVFARVLRSVKDQCATLFALPEVS